MDYVVTIKMSPEGARAAIEKLAGWEGTEHLVNVPQDENSVLTIWKVPNPTVAAGIVLTCGGWYDDLVWGDYKITPNVPVPSNI